jgi:uncharacterized repeat protein (TIGR02543 family)
LTANGFTRTGYTFGGWSRTADGAVEFSDAESVTNLTVTPNDIVTLYAVWVKVPDNNNGGDGGGGNNDGGNSGGSGDSGGGPTAKGCAGAAAAVQLLLLAAAAAVIVIKRK